MTLAGYQNLNVYYGDLHSHCNVGIAYGSAEEAFQNARTQLDFATVTAQTYWPDMPKPVGYLKPIVAYHVEGFRRADQLWQHLKEVTAAAHGDGRFVSFLSFEWHTARHGDHVVIYKDGTGNIIRAENLDAMRAELRRLAGQGVKAFLVPHHIAYVSGYRGIRWEEFTSEFSPVVEILSMHGVSESDDAPYQYLHDMGPRDGRNTMQAGLRQGKVFGVVGSTDHHSAHPGSYGRGRAGVWANELTRDSLWEAIAARRTYALTGDRIALQFSVNGRAMGSVLPATPERHIEASVVGGAPLDYVEVLWNNRPIHRWSAHEASRPRADDPMKVLLEVGWGQYGKDVDWQVDLDVVGGQLLSVEPRLRGAEILSPQAKHGGEHAFSSWRQNGDTSVTFVTRTWGNPNTSTPGMQGICLEILPKEGAEIRGRINGREVRVSLSDLKQSSQAAFLGEFLSPAYLFHRAVPRTEYICQTRLIHTSHSAGRDWYYVRVRQQNNQWAWSSPIWVDAL